MSSFVRYQTPQNLWMAQVNDYHKRTDPNGYYPFRDESDKPPVPNPGFDRAKAFAAETGLPESEYYRERR